MDQSASLWSTDHRQRLQVSDQGLPFHRWEYMITAVRDRYGEAIAAPSFEDFLSTVSPLGEEGWEVYALTGGAIHLKRIKT